MTEESNLTQIWLRKDPRRWAAGALAGLFAGGVMAVFSVLLAAVLGAEDMWMPIRLVAVPFLGGEALAFAHPSSIMVGFLIHEVLCLFLGVIFAHFTGTNSLLPLLGVGVSWGAFSWVFLQNLFTRSFREVYVANIPTGAAFFSCMVFGVALVSVSFFDRVLRRR